MALSETANRQEAFTKYRVKLTGYCLFFSGGGEVWWSSWISSAKEKSVSALNATKRDLAEFVSVLGTDTKAAVKEASDNIKVMVQVSTVEGGEGRNNQKNGSAPSMEVQVAAPYDRCQAEVFAVQNSPETYLQDPSQGQKT